MVMPGDNIQMTVTLIAPIAMEDGLRFAIREGGRTRRRRRRRPHHRVKLKLMTKSAQVRADFH